MMKATIKTLTMFAAVAAALAFPASGEDGEPEELPKLDERYTKWYGSDSATITDVEALEYQKCVAKLLKGVSGAEAKSAVAAICSTINTCVKRAGENGDAKRLDCISVKAKVVVFANLAKDAESSAVKKAAEAELAAAKKKSATLDKDMQQDVVCTELMVYGERIKARTGVDLVKMNRFFGSGIPVWEELRRDVRLPDDAKSKGIMQAGFKHDLANIEALSVLDDLLYAKTAGAAKKALPVLEQKMGVSTRTLLPSVGGMKPPKEFVAMTQAEHAVEYAVIMHKAGERCEIPEVKALLQAKAKDLKAKAAVLVKKVKVDADKSQLEGVLQEL